MWISSMTQIPVQGRTMMSFWYTINSPGPDSSLQLIFMPHVQSTSAGVQMLRQPEQFRPLHPQSDCSPVTAILKDNPPKWQRGMECCGFHLEPNWKLPHKDWYWSVSSKASDNSSSFYSLSVISFTGCSQIPWKFVFLGELFRVLSSINKRSTRTDLCVRSVSQQL